MADNQGAVNGSGGSTEGSTAGEQRELNSPSLKNTLEEQKRKLFGQFCNPLHEEEVYVIREEAKALQKVEDFLNELVTTGELAEKANEGDNE